MDTFIDLLNRNEEFVFTYNGVKYEIVNGDEYGRADGSSLYLSDGGYGTYLHYYFSKEYFLQYGKIDGKYISEVLDQIEV